MTHFHNFQLRGVFNIKESGNTGDFVKKLKEQQCSPKVLPHSQISHNN